MHEYSEYLNIIPLNFEPQLLSDKMFNYGTKLYSIIRTKNSLNNFSHTFNDLKNTCTKL